ncbi:alanine racemase [Microbacteriaceae bacterium SG_E_30_P1]|uniref:Alanine racemase n=1 Tax=Antiquaquibacter oligotrophicus TaxID=2880260 RepID=A0ABT6KMP3_9MICO|nr:alanine racemase [Antiquaquibacter oligotrophicus]MDH6181046.1 alanine racemase [Antiquaquibacter oligotrophicus]UDF13256.1 alanine racemase [Antiquaquibacter oligotrophicus]
MTSPRLDIDLGAFAHNVGVLSEIAKPSRTMLAVKANAYGHGMVPLARRALESGADSLAVLDVPAALALRRDGIDAQLFAWLHSPETDFERAIEADVDLGISSLWELEAIVAAWHGKPARVHLKIDTGLHRNGARPEDWPALVSAAMVAARDGYLRIEGIWSHLADASPEDDAEALTKLLEAVETARDLGCTPPLLHLAASSAGIREPEARLDLVRFGIAAYGISPFDDESGRDLGLRGVMTMRAPLSKTEGGEGIIALGTADGVPPNAAGRGEVTVRGRRHRVVSVDIDRLAFELGESAAEAGDDVIVFGPGDDGEATAEEWARWCETIGDEIVARAGERLPRFYRD